MIHRRASGSQGSSDLQGSLLKGAAKRGRFGSFHWFGFLSWLLLALLWVPAQALAQFNGTSGIYALNHMTFGVMLSPITIVSGGAGYSPGDVLTLDCGDTFVIGTKPTATVGSVNPSGAITSITLTAPGYSTKIPSTGLASGANGVCNFTSTGGTGTGAIIYGVFGFNAATINNSSTVTITASTVLFYPPWPGGVPTTLQARGQNIVYATDFGASGSTATASGSSVNGAAVTLGSAQNFANGQGIAIPTAGPAGPSVATTCAGAFTGTGGGSSTIRYWVAPLDANGGYGAASSCDVTGVNLASFTGAITIGPTNLAVSATAYGVLAAHQLLIIPGTSNASGNTLLNQDLTGGNWLLSNNETAPIASETMYTNLNAQNYVTLTITPGALSTFSGSITAGSNLLIVTGSVIGAPLTEGMWIQTGINPVRIIGYGTGTGGAGTYYVDNSIQTASGTWTAFMGYAVWKQCITNCNTLYTSEKFLGLGDQNYVVGGSNTVLYIDNGILSRDAGGGNAPWTPIWLGGNNATHPTTAGNGWCVAKITAGGGTTSLAISPACPNPASGVVARHDDTAAINLCLAAAGTWQCILPPGTYNITSAILSPGNSTLVGSGRGITNIQHWGNQDAWDIEKGGSGGGNFSEADLGTGNVQTGGLGHGIMSDQGSSIDLQNIDLSWNYYGFESYDSGLSFLENIHIDHMRGQTAVCAHVNNDGNGGGAIGTWLYWTCGTVGSFNNYGTRQIGFHFNGAVGGGNGYSGVVASIAGEGVRLSKDNGSSTGPNGMKWGRFDVEFPIGHALDIAAANRGNRFEDSGFETGGWKNFVDCKTSSGLYIASGVSDQTFIGTSAYGSSGAGIWVDGNEIPITGGLNYNNSSTGPGGISGNCNNMEVGSTGHNVAFSGIATGLSADRANAPIVFDAGSYENSAVGNSFAAAGHILNHAINNGAASNVIGCNGGSDVPDCHVIAPAPGQTYQGIGDLGLASLSHFWGIQPVSKTYHGNVLDIWDAATGSTTETILTASPGGFLNETVNPLATTCAISCRVKEAYDQVGTTHMLQSNNALRPNFLTTGCGFSLPGAYPYCLQLTGTQYLQATGVTPVAQSIDLFTVAQRTGNFANANYLFTTGTTGAGGYIRFNIANQITVNFGTGTNQTANDLVWHAMMAEGDNTTSAVQVDGTLASGLSLGTNGADVTWTLGATSTGTNPTTGLIAEAFMASAANGPNAAGGSLFPLINANIHTRYGF